MRKIVVVTGTRAEYGILKPVLKAIKKHPRLDLALVVTGMHLSTEFGYTINEIRKDGFKIDAKIDILHKRDTGAAMVKSAGKCLAEMAGAMNKMKPDVLVLLGDRSETLAGAIAASYMSIPIAHIDGGAVSGNIDDSVRHAITRLAHIHLPTTKKSADRITKMGEDPSRISIVGAPAIDTILNEKLLGPDELSEKYCLDLSKPTLLVIQHPVTTETNAAAKQIRETLEAIANLKHQTVLIYPNADAGGRRMIEIIKRYERHPFIRSFKSIPYIDYLSLMNVASVMVGNSSSGIVEAPPFHLPVVNIGSRQGARERSTNVIDVKHDRKAIARCIRKAIRDKKFRAKVRRCRNPYGDGKTGPRIANILARKKIDSKLLQKKLTY